MPLFVVLIYFVTLNIVFWIPISVPSTTFLISTKYFPCFSVFSIVNFTFVLLSVTSNFAVAVVPSINVNGFVVVPSSKVTVSNIYFVLSSFIFVFTLIVIGPFNFTYCVAVPSVTENVFSWFKVLIVVVPKFIYPSKFVTFSGVSFVIPSFFTVNGIPCIPVVVPFLTFNISKEYSPDKFWFGTVTVTFLPSVLDVKPSWTIFNLLFVSTSVSLVLSDISAVDVTPPTIYSVPDSFLLILTVILISFNIAYPAIVLFSVITHLSEPDISVIGCLLLSPLIYAKPSLPVVTLLCVLSGAITLKLTPGNVALVTLSTFLIFKV